MRVILVPSRKIWTPLEDAKQKWQRFLTKYQEGKLQRGAGGKMRRNASGKLVRNSSTSSTCCCGATFWPVFDCDTNEITEYTIRVGTITTPTDVDPFVFGYAGFGCFYIDGETEPVEDPGTELLVGDVEEIESCEDCEFDVCTDCGIPSSVTFTLSGLSVPAIACCDGLEFEGGSLTFAAISATSSGGGCIWTGSAPTTSGPNINVWSASDCTGTIDSTIDTYDAGGSIDLNTGAWSFTAAVSGLSVPSYVIFHASGVISGCDESFAFGNQVSGSCTDFEGDKLASDGSGSLAISINYP